jgi:hypothetical protein
MWKSISNILDHEKSFVKETLTQIYREIIITISSITIFLDIRRPN